MSHSLSHSYKHPHTPKAMEGDWIMDHGGSRIADVNE